MLRQLLALLLLVVLSAPAVGMSGHCEPAPESAVVSAGAEHGHGTHAAAAQRDTGGDHSAPVPAERRDCIGCVLPALDAPAPAEGPVPAGGLRTATRASALAPAPLAPEPPPPRA